MYVLELRRVATPTIELTFILDEVLEHELKHAAFILSMADDVTGVRLRDPNDIIIYGYGELA